MTNQVTTEDTILTVTITVTSNSPVNWLNKAFYGPNGNIYGGGSGVSFTETLPGIWEYTRTDTISKYAPSGKYYYSNISVENEGQMESDVWPNELSIDIVNSITPEKPVITAVNMTNQVTTEGTKLMVTITVTSNSPVNWLNKNFYGPNGNIYGGGSGVSFTEKWPGVWEYTRIDTISKYAPSGKYYYNNISVENEGQMESDVA
ncbi:MAG: hypothetical protein PHX14_10195 [Syntrophomonadaceae bacterium]|nr:hypothetical protein [Syntrophomonadaceae bacterium]